MALKAIIISKCLCVSWKCCHFFFEITELMPCGSPAELENGEFVFCSISGKLVAVYSCRHGYRLEGQEEVLCTESGWSSQAPICKGRRLPTGLSLFSFPSHWRASEDGDTPPALRIHKNVLQ